MKNQSKEFADDDHIMLVEERTEEAINFLYAVVDPMQITQMLRSL